MRRRRRGEVGEKGAKRGGKEEERMGRRVAIEISEFPNKRTRPIATSFLSKELYLSLSFMKCVFLAITRSYTAELVGW